MVTVSCPPLLSWIFRSKQSSSSSSSSSGSSNSSDASTIIKSLLEGSIDDVKTAVQSPTFSLCVTQMQHLDLPRDVRRGRNKQLVFCLGESQATAFIVMKDKMNVETAQMIIQDFRNSNTKLEKLADSVEDLKTLIMKRYHEDLSCGHFNTERTCMRCTEGPKQTADGLGASLARFGKVLMSYLDVTKDSALAIKLISLIGMQIFTEPALFQSVIIWLLIASIVVPLLKSAVETALWYPHAVLDSSASTPSGSKLKVPPSSSFLWILLCPFTAHYQQGKGQTEKKDFAGEN